MSVYLIYKLNIIGMYIQGKNLYGIWYYVVLDIHWGSWNTFPVDRGDYFSVSLFFYCLKIFFIREHERRGEAEREGESSLSSDPNMGLDSRTQGPGPELKADP